MTVLLLSLGAAGAALGTRASVLAFVGAAAVGARNASPLLASLSTWTAALLGAWVLLDDGPVRRIATAGLGAAAVVAAAAAPNAAVVLGLWVLGTTAAVLARGTGASADRWAALLCVSDVLFAVAIASTVTRGFEGWPFTISTPGMAALIAAAVLRAPLAGGSMDERSSVAAGLGIVRLQTVLLVAYAAVAAPPATLRALIVLAAVGFAVATLAPRRVTLDAAQEVSLAALAIASSRLRWLPSGWVWGTLAAGTVMHQLRFSLRSGRSGAFASLVRRSAGIGLPLLPVVGAQLQAAFRVHEWTSAVVLAGLLCGLAGRTRAFDEAEPLAEAERQERGRNADRIGTVRRWLPLLMAVAITAWAPLLSLPKPPAGDEIAWPSLWAVVVLLVAAALGTRVPSGGVRPPVPSSPPVAVVYEHLRVRVGVLDAVLVGRSLWVLFAVVVAAAAGLWAVGLVRGFL